MIVDQNIHLLTPWDIHVGAGIGGVPPASYGVEMLPGIAKFYTAGPAYSDWLAAQHRPICPNTGNLTLSFSLMTDDLAPAAAQALEFDTRVSIAGLNYNFSAQFNYAEGGTFQIVDNGGHWVDTGWKPGKFEPWIWYPIVLMYRFDTAKRTFSFMGASNGVSVAVPTGMQNLAAANLSWADSASVQVQQDIAGMAGAFSEYIKEMNLTWS